MVPSRAILNKIMSLWATYIDGKITAPGWTMQAVKNAFVPSPNLVAADVTIDADWANVTVAINASIITGSNPQNSYYAAWNPLQPAVDSSNTGVLRTVYGWVIIETGTGVVLASELSPNPIAINATLQVAVTPVLMFQMPATAVR